MIRALEDLPADVVGVEASGTVTDDDCENVRVPVVQERVEADAKVRFRGPGKCVSRV